MIKGVKLRPQLLKNDRTISHYTGMYSRPGLYEPYEYYATWLAGSIGYLGAANVAVPHGLNVINKYYDVQDITMCFDGTWVRVGEGFKFVTVGNPVVAIVKLTGDIEVTDSNGRISLIPGNFEKVALIRGWKSLIDDDDQGLLLAASTGKTIYLYKLSTNWYEHSVYENPEDITELRFTLLADYRLCMYIISENNTRLMYTDRHYIGGAAAPAIANISSLKLGQEEVSIQAVQKTSYKLREPECVRLPKLTLSDSINTLACYKPLVKSNIRAHNPNDSTVHVYVPCVFFIRDAEKLLHDIVISTEAGVEIPIESISQVGWWLEIQCVRFNNVAGDFTISYNNSNNSLSMVSGEIIDSFTTVFTPTDLIPDGVDPPVIVDVINVEVI